MCLEARRSQKMISGGGRLKRWNIYLVPCFLVALLFVTPLHTAYQTELLMVSLP